MSRFLLLALPLLLGACHQATDAPAAPQYADWYALTAPDNRAIEAVSGNLDGTLVITTRFRIYRTTDQGKTWKQADYKEPAGLTGFAQRRDSLLATAAQWGDIVDSTTISYGANAAFYSLDQGATWRPNHNPGNYGLRVPLNRLKNPAGTEYSVTIRQLPVSPGSKAYYTQTTGIKSQAGRRLALPHDHQIRSLYFDAQSRLYVAASAPVCAWGAGFAYCGAENGVLYVSRRPQL